MPQGPGFIGYCSLFVAVVHCIYQRVGYKGPEGAGDYIGEKGGNSGVTEG